MQRYKLEFKSHSEALNNCDLSLILIFSILFSIYCFEYVWLYLTLVVIFIWSEIYAFLYTLFLKTKIAYCTPYLTSEHQTIPFNPLPHIENTKEALRDYLQETKSSSSITIYPTFSTSSDTLNLETISSIYTLLGYKMLFSSFQFIYLFFVLSFFILNFIYGMIIFSLLEYMQIDHLSLYIGGLITLFGITIFTYVNHLHLKHINTILHNLPLKSLDNKYLVYLYENNDLSHYQLSNIIQDIKSIKKNFDKVTTTLLQVSIPIFFLGYVSIFLISMY